MMMIVNYQRHRFLLAIKECIAPLAASSLLGDWFYATVTFSVRLWDSRLSRTIFTQAVRGRPQDLWQNSTKASYLNQRWSGIQIQNSGLNRTGRHQSFRQVSWKSAGVCMRNADKSKIFYSTTKAVKWSRIRIWDQIIKS